MYRETFYGRNTSCSEVKIGSEWRSSGSKEHIKRNENSRLGFIVPVQVQ